MTTAKNFDLNRLRNPYESAKEWRMREEFLKAHKDKFPVYRLLCLSNCYINSEVYGCRYPPSVMEQLKHLKSELPEADTTRRKGVEKVEFVKAKEPAENPRKRPAEQDSTMVASKTLILEKKTGEKSSVVVQKIIGIKKSPSPTKGATSDPPPKEEPVTPTKLAIKPFKLGPPQKAAIKVESKGKPQADTGKQPDVSATKSQATANSTEQTNATKVSSSKTEPLANTAQKPSNSQSPVTLQLASTTVNSQQQPANLPPGAAVKQETQGNKPSAAISQEQGYRPQEPSKQVFIGPQFPNQGKPESGDKAQNATTDNIAPHDKTARDAVSKPPNGKDSAVNTKGKQKQSEDVKKMEEQDIKGEENKIPTTTQELISKDPTKMNKLRAVKMFNPDVTNTKFADFMMPIDQKFFSLAQKYNEMKKKDKNFKPADILPIISMKCRMMFSYVFGELPAPKGQHLFTCQLTCENVEMALGKGTSKKRAKQNSVEIAGSTLARHYLKVARNNDGLAVLQGSDEHFPSAWSLFEPQLSPTASKAPIHRESNEDQLVQRNKPRFQQVHGDLSRFLIIEPLNASESENAKHILHQSAQFNCALLEYEFQQDSTGTRCRVFLEKENIVDYLGTSKLDSKAVAAEKALSCLRKFCWTIKIKQAVDSDKVSLTRDEVMNELQQESGIPQDNKGNEMLRKMGWTGGGLGADGNKGMETPVAVAMQKITKREGLGMNTGGSFKDFRDKVIQVIEKYCRSESQEDLVFAPEFDDTERAFIHQMAYRYALKTVSRGTGANRYLSVSRKRSPHQLFDHIIAEGGETSKYILIPPEY